MKQHQTKDIFVIGFALFSMFFGAGNVIFPPFLGLGAGPEWLLGYICYYLADIGLALVALYSVFRKDGMDKVMEPIGKTGTNLLMCAVVLCIGPMVALPRTAAMTFEMSVMPFFIHLPKAAGVGFSILFFVVIFLLTIRESSVVDIVGKFLTPALMVGLFILIVKGILFPLGTPSAAPQTPDVVVSGIKAGYQTMDVLATVLFGAIIMHSVEGKGYTSASDRRKVAVRSGLVAGVALMLVYGGLTYLGASVSQIYDLSMGRSALVMNIVYGLLGKAGTVIFALVVGLACVTTAVGLVSSCADYFAELSGGKLAYPVMVVGICAFSAIAANIGLDTIVSIAAPVLDIVYPPMLILILLSYIPRLPDLSYRLGLAASLVFSVLGAVQSYMGIPIPFLDKLPFTAVGFGWLLPTLAFAALGLLFRKRESDETAISDHRM